jgi:hypothetical protein
LALARPLSKLSRSLITNQLVVTFSQIQVSNKAKSFYSGDIWLIKSAPSPISLRTAMIVLGTGLLAGGASSRLFQIGFGFWKGFDWKALSVGIIRVAECSRWFFTVVNATRELYKRWP